ncbi:MAG: hypothetical protein DPW18_16935 [Chloroflexi bacterium]|nr:hypothetical protein [Chloroflexota bacterium]MDL1940710.1 hypothetical protein [Chloroflexi bacterium CFX2]
MAWFSSSKQGEAKKLVSQLSDANVDKRDRAAQELIRLGGDAVPALLDALQTQDLNLLPIYEHLLARIPSASPVMAKSLLTAHPLIRGRIAEVFAISKDKNALLALIEALRGEYYTVRSRAAAALGKIGDPGAVEPLLGALKDGEMEVRIAACIALGHFKDPATFDELGNLLLEDSMIEVRQTAAKVLGATKHPAAVPYLMDALRDSFWWYEREQAVRDLLAAIKNMGEPVVQPLIEALGDREGTVRKFAAMILGDLQDGRAIEELGMALYDLHHEVSQAAAQALARFGAPAIGVLEEALNHPEMWIRIHSVGALSKIKDTRIFPILLQMLDDPEREVRREVVRSLGELGDARALPALQAVFSNRADRELQALAKEAMSKLN